MRINWRWVLFWVILFSFWYFWPTEGRDNRQLRSAKEELAPVELRLSSQACLTPCEVRVLLRTARHPDNRYAAIVWDYGSHEWELDGENAPVEHPPITILFREGGEYDIYGVLLRITNGKRVVFQDKKRLIVATRGS